MSPSQHRVLQPAPWNRGKLVGSKPPQAQGGLGNPDPAGARWQAARPRPVQPGDRQQAPRLRSRAPAPLCGHMTAHCRSPLSAPFAAALDFEEHRQATAHSRCCVERAERPTHCRQDDLPLAAAGRFAPSAARAVPPFGPEIAMRCGPEHVPWASWRPDVVVNRATSRWPISIPVPRRTAQLVLPRNTTSRVLPREPHPPGQPRHREREHERA